MIKDASQTKKKISLKGNLTTNEIKLNLVLYDF